jgi:hypothetical protein
MRLRTTYPLLILTTVWLAACTDAQRLVNDADTIRGDCTEEGLRAADDACVDAFDRGARHLESAMEVFAGALRTLDRLAAERGGVHFDTSFASMPVLDSLLAREARAARDPRTLRQPGAAGEDFRGERYGYRDAPSYESYYDERLPRNQQAEPYDRAEPYARAEPYGRGEPHGYRPEPFGRAEPYDNRPEAYGNRPEAYGTDPYRDRNDPRYDRGRVDEYERRAGAPLPRDPARDAGSDRDAAGALTYGALTERRAAAYDELLRRRAGNADPAPGGYMQPRHRTEPEYLRPYAEPEYRRPRLESDYRRPRLESDYRRPYLEPEYPPVPRTGPDYPRPPQRGYAPAPGASRYDDECYVLESELRRSLAARAPMDTRRIAGLMAELEAWCVAPVGGGPRRDDGKHFPRSGYEP